MEEMISIDVICSNGNMFSVGSSLGSKVVEFKEELAQISYIPANEFRLIYRGKTLEDDRTLASYGIQEYHTIHMEIPNNPWFAETETTSPSGTTTGALRLQMGKMIMIEIICSNGDMFSVRSSVGSKVVDFKELLAEIYYVPANEQRLIYRGKTLEDDRTLDSYGLKEYHTIHMDVAKNRPTGGMPDMSLLYPPIFQITQTLLSSPQLREHIIGQNPQLRSMFDSNPELSDMIQHHEVVRCLTSPQMMQAPESQLELPRQNLIRHSIIHSIHMGSATTKEQ
ncbi:ubiquitin domain-containing protein DSK2b-like protein [Tanacetum coccineum]